MPSKSARTCSPACTRAYVRTDNPACPQERRRVDGKVASSAIHELVERERSSIVRDAETGCGVNVTFQRASTIAH